MLKIHLGARALTGGQMSLSKATHRSALLSKCLSYSDMHKALLTYALDSVSHLDVATPINKTQTARLHGSITALLK